MKIGIFDSGLGGLIVLKAIKKKLPQYDYAYLGDTKRLPYGNRTPEAVYKYATECVDYLFRNGCELIIVACNTVSSEALRKLQQVYLPKKYPNRRILGVIVPTLEEVRQKKLSHIAIIGTTATVHSKAYIKQLKKIDSSIKVSQKATPLLVPMIEKHELKKAEAVLKSYLESLLKKNPKAIVLGCTHYCLLKNEAEKFVGKNVAILSQDDIIPKKLKIYLKKHPEITTKLSKKGTIQLLATKVSPVYNTLAKEWFGKSASLKLVRLKP